MSGLNRRYCFWFQITCKFTSYIEKNMKLIFACERCLTNKPGERCLLFIHRTGIANATIQPSPNWAWPMTVPQPWRGRNSSGRAIQSPYPFSIESFCWECQFGCQIMSTVMVETGLMIATCTQATKEFIDVKNFFSMPTWIRSALTGKRFRIILAVPWTTQH